jgi:integrase/recombinase XerD
MINDVKYNKNNEFVKYKFFSQLKHSGINNKAPRDEKTITQYINAIHEFEVATNFKDFKKFNQEMAIIFKDYLADKKNKRTGQNVSKSLYFHYINYVREFFDWLIINENEYSHIKKLDISFLKTTQNDKNRALATNPTESYMIAEILATIRKMHSTTDIEKRNKAMISLCLLTTPRISALQTARIGSIKYLKEYEIYAFMQDSKLVDTKFARTITACFIGQSQDIIDNIISWQAYLTNQGFKEKDYLFPKIVSTFTKERNHILAIKKEFIESDSWVRQTVFKKAFEGNNLKYLKPHSFRHSMARAMKKISNGVELSIALAENYGHKSGMSTLHASYGGDYLQTQAHLMKSFLLE